MEYPLTFPNRLKPLAEAAVRKAQSPFQELHQARERISAAVLAFAEIACKAAESGQWRADLALDGLDVFLRTLCACDRAAHGFTDSGGFDRFASPIKQEIKDSEEWLACLERLSALHGAQTHPLETSRRERLADEHKTTADSGRVEPEVAKRRAIIRSNPGTPNQGLCTLLDNQHVPVPRGWVSSNWTQAYKSPKCRSKVQVILAKEKQKRV